MQICVLLLTGQGWIQLQKRSSDDVNNQTDVKRLWLASSNLGKSCCTVWEMCSAAENMKIHHHRLQEHHVTYLKWSKEKVKLPRFNVHRQTADKQCSYLHTESIKMILSRDEYLECGSFPSPRQQKPSFRRSPLPSSLLLKYWWIYWTFTNRKPLFISEGITVRQTALGQAPEMSHS